MDERDSTPSTNQADELTGGPEASGFDESLLEILRCPRTREHLLLRGGELVSPAARLAYPIEDGIPVLLEESARELSAEELSGDESGD